MLLSKGLVKLRSLGLSPLVLALATGLGGAASAGCIIVDGHDHGDVGNDDPTDPGDDTTTPDDPSIEQVAIQPDQVLESKPGEGVGIFVEYMAGGKWHVWTACDTFDSGQVCAFDIFAGTSRPESLLAYGADDIEGTDALVDLGDGTVELIADTDSDPDGVVLELEAGTPLILEVYLDEQSAEPFVYWVSDNVVHGGAPTNPVEFVPSAP